LGPFLPASEAGPRNVRARTWRSWRRMTCQQTEDSRRPRRLAEDLPVERAGGRFEKCPNQNICRVPEAIRNSPLYRKQHPESARPSESLQRLVHDFRSPPPVPPSNWSNRFHASSRIALGVLSGQQAPEATTAVLTEPFSAHFQLLTRLLSTGAAP